jgi:7-cyano-7-deazaguanine reductase
MTDLADTPLGQPTHYPQQHDARLLCPIPRALARAGLGLTGPLPFMGADLWTAYELSWLNPRGKPQVALAHLTVPCETPFLLESKSLKLYLGSLAHSPFTDASAVQALLRRELTQAVWGDAVVQSSVGVRLVGPEQFDAQPLAELDGLNLDRLDLDCTAYSYDPSGLRSATDEAPVTETLTTRLFRSLCPVTGQPDWASVQVRYFGPQIDQAGLLRYLVGYRDHADFHEACVERIYTDLWQRCRPHSLAVYARFTRRGGLDINPFRASAPCALPTPVRTARQ